MLSTNTIHYSEIHYSDAHKIVIVGSEVPDKASFGIKLNGNNMKPRYMNGQMVWVYRTTEFYDSNIGIFYLDGQAEERME
ncbi:hypothetical protein SAMN06297422_11548 [Lachnospiraceae bacterium]|nr:hypothetical protein SAMN06297422_11548 [Lachnospiraceae bacterium]